MNTAESGVYMFYRDYKAELLELIQKAVVSFIGVTAILAIAVLFS